MTITANQDQVGQRLDMSNPACVKTGKGDLIKKTLNVRLPANLAKLTISSLMTRGANAQTGVQPVQPVQPQAEQQLTNERTPMAEQPHHPVNHPHHHTSTGVALNFFVPGKPAPQGSKRHLGRGILIESSKEVGPWRERIAITAHNAMAGQKLFPGPLTIDLQFVLPRPKSAPKRYTPAAVRRPDIDKLARAALDAITGVVIGDDAQITTMNVTKRLAEIGETPGAHIRLMTPTQHRKDNQ